MGKRKKWIPAWVTGYTYRGGQKPLPRPRKNKLIRADATPDEKRSPAADADKRQG